MKYLLNRILEPASNGPAIATILAQLLQVKITSATIKKELEDHPDYPSLLSISDVLHQFGIDNVSINIAADKFSDTPVPFITQIKGLKDRSTFFTVVKSNSKNRITYFNPEKHDWDSASSDDFFNRCSGVVLLTEVAHKNGEAEFDKNRTIEKQQTIIHNILSLWMPSVVFITGLFSVQQAGLSALLPFLYVLLALTGSIAALLLLWYELDRYNPILQQICGNAAKKINCSAVLQSKSSKIAGISWSTIGFSYFTGNLILHLFLGFLNPMALCVSAWLSIFALPYVFFSVYYQWRIAKQWCMLCLFVQCPLVLQVIVSTTSGWYTLVPVSDFSSQLLIQSVSAFSIPFMVISILFPILRKAKEREKLNSELQKLKHDRAIFEALLGKQKLVTHSPAGLGITLGNPGATYKIIKVCNPYCGPCAKAHEPIDELLQNNEDLQIQIVFTATSDALDRQGMPVKHLLAIDEAKDEALSKRALDDWYLAENKDYEIFAEKYPMNGELNKQVAKIDMMHDWCTKMEIAFTPTFFISIPSSDGLNTAFHQLPGMYRPNDLKYFLSV
jgi:uncharacterized membrane protein